MTAHANDLEVSVVESSAPTLPATSNEALPAKERPTKERLLATAVDLLAEKGSFDQVSLRSIAAGAGVTPTAVYRHFTDHAALLEAVADWCWQRFDQAVFGAGGDATNPTDRFLAQGLAYIDFAREYPGIYRVLMDRRFDDVTRTNDGQAVFAKLVSVVAEILGQKGDDRDPVVVATLVHTWIHGVATLNLTELGRSPGPEELVMVLGSVLGLGPDC